MPGADSTRRRTQPWTVVIGRCWASNSKWAGRGASAGTEVGGTWIVPNQLGFSL